MGLTAALGVGLGLLGVGTAAASAVMTNKAMKKANQGMADANDASKHSLLDLQNENSSALLDLPQAPEAPTNDPNSNSAAEQARKDQLAAIAAADNANMTNPTGGLGVGGTPNVQKKQLLGV